jgi:hypothetical protein
MSPAICGLAIMAETHALLGSEEIRCSVASIWSTFTRRGEKWGDDDDDDDDDDFDDDVCDRQTDRDR